MKIKISLTILIYLIINSLPAYCQADKDILTRLQALNNNSFVFYNIDGIEITSQNSDNEFTKKNILKKFKLFSIKESELINSDSLIKQNNFVVKKQVEEVEGIKEYSNYYFIENSEKKIVAITFAQTNKNDHNFEREFITLILENKIPENVFSNMQIDSINFAGRKIALGKSCNWMGVNNVQCSSYGQMNWSVHKTFDDAILSTTSQANKTKANKKAKLVSETNVPVVFEGQEIEAKKTIYDFNGVSGLLTGMTGSETLIIFYVSAPVRQNFVSCVMSFWTNDNIRPSGLPGLLEEVMTLKK